ncbi:flagellar protein FlaG [Pseudoalteromonas sp. JC3]|uniref:flagellar protein FlaG n=1 Tax=Pseudoalteromonas sp. JC3 TaxID=2810196 RepID=UPI0019D27D35|nr:flagellar protein FlaG [Pseudoalteromonas sp. JC3]MBR8842633.1 flagellar protein FlaG [Pseudoalteromonas sp. JC3]WJE10107.1 flagellar protein FlaG [Pseudoalteromonas sp. JC3]
MIDMNSTQRPAETLSSDGSTLKPRQLSNKELKDFELMAEEPIAGNVESGIKLKSKLDLVNEVKQNLEKLNEYLPVTSTNLVFEFDEQGEPPIIKVFDKESEEVIREIPTEEFREVAKALEEFADKLSSKGFLFNKTA